MKPRTLILLGVGGVVVAYFLLKPSTTTLLPAPGSTLFGGTFSAVPGTVQAAGNAASSILNAIGNLTSDE
ncbi:hypothetical protein [Anaeromyxobacter paludicola]|uniref:Uncharacterized protein n=1 Tax=Anaeromyxobacter paludicola TaxID=2918171 RepID=A0ABM7X6Z4_9BACT|nr:hypothetical protein [Anaeromyxobacter paludicola]BDG07607.1 hypothetical protein AMPC_07200 [Anaeromyxobacter paludicola]